MTRPLSHHQHAFTLLCGVATPNEQHCVPPFFPRCSPPPPTQPPPEPASHPPQPPTPPTPTHPAAHHALCRHAAELQEAGAARVVINNSEAGLTLGSQLLEALGASEVETSMLRRDIAGAMAVRTDALAGAIGKAEASGGSRKNAVEVFALDPRALMSGGGATASMMDANAGGLLQSPMSSFEEMEPINGNSRSSSRAGSADESVSGSSIGSVGSSVHESMHESSLASVDSTVMSGETRGTAVRTMSAEDVSGSMHQEQKH